MTRLRTLGIPMMSVVAIGLAAFALTRVFVGGDDDSDARWIVPLSTPTSTIDLDPEGQALDALEAAVEEFGPVLGIGVDLDDPIEHTTMDWDDPVVAAEGDAQFRRAFGLSDDEPLPERLLEELPDDVVAELRGELPAAWGADAFATNVDLTARGYEPPSAPASDPDPVPPEDDVWEEVDPELPFVARELPVDDLPGDVGDAEGELGDPEELDALFSGLLGGGLDGIRIIDDLPMLEFDLPTDEPDFLDACAATVDGVPLECGDGMGGTVLPMVGPLAIVSVSIDNGGLRCRSLEPGEGLPVRASFNRPVTDATITWEGTGDDGVRTRHDVPVNRVEAVHWSALQPDGVWHYCLRLPTDPTSRRYTAEVRAADIFGQRVTTTVELARPPWLAEGRPATVLEPLGDRRMLVHVPARNDGTVRAHLIVRDPSQVGFASQCDPAQLAGDATDWSRWAGPGEPVWIRPAHRLATTPAAAIDPSYDRTLVYDLSFRPVDLDAPMATFELCLTWLDTSGATTEAVAREHHLISPPSRPIVDVLIEGGGMVDGPDAWIDIRQPAEATNGTTVRTAGDRLIINDPGSICTQGVDAGSLARATTTPQHVCRFELTDERTEVLLATTMRANDARGTRPSDHVRLVPLPGSLSHPRGTAGCSRCADSHVAYGWLTPDGAARGQRPDAQINVRFVISGDAFEPWLTLPLLAEEVRAERPMLNVRQTTIVRAADDPVRGIDLRYVADRPVRARVVARPATSGRTDGTPPAGCPAESVPHVVASEDFAVEATLSIGDACALTDYRFALELRDESGTRAVYGDLLSWLIATRTTADLLSGDDAYVPTSWRPRLRTRGHQWDVRSEVQVYLSAHDRIPGGVYVGEAAAPASVRPPRPTGSVFDFTRDELVVASGFSQARRSFLQQLQVEVGAASMMHGRAGGDGRRCLDPVARYGPRGRYVEVGDMVTIRATGHLELRYAGCGENLIIGNPLHGTPQLRLPPAPDSPTGIAVYQFPAEELAIAGRATLVLNSPVVCAYYARVDDGCVGDPVPHWWHEAVVTVRVIPDSPPSRTLIGES